MLLYKNHHSPELHYNQRKPKRVLQYLYIVPLYPVQVKHQRHGHNVTKTVRALAIIYILAYNIGKPLLIRRNHFLYLLLSFPGLDFIGDHEAHRPAAFGFDFGVALFDFRDLVRVGFFDSLD